MMVRIITGDCRAVLATLPAESVHCVVTSPPYWGLRDYGTAKWEGGDSACDHIEMKIGMSDKNMLGRDGYLPPNNAANVGRFRQFKSECGKCSARRIDAQLGLEPSYQDFVAEMVAVFREVRRVLRADGTLWLNLGDTYSSGGRTSPQVKQLLDGPATPVDGSRRAPPQEGIKPKDLIGVPWRVAFALQADGWYLRQDIIWHKPNPMPESVTDRCTKAHEYMFLLSKNERYYFDADSIKESASYNPERTKFPDGWDTGPGGHGSFHRSGREKGRASGNKTHKGVTEYERSETEEHRTKAGLLKISETAYPIRNKRSVWEVATQPFSEAHFATFPPALIEPCILAGCPKGGTVLDPFGGAGTTGLVADRLQRNAILIELNPAYAEMAERRIYNDAPLFAVGNQEAAE